MYREVLSSKYMVYSKFIKNMISYTDFYDMMLESSKIETNGEDKLSKSLLEKDMNYIFVCIVENEKHNND